MVSGYKLGFSTESKDPLYLEGDTAEGKKSGQWQASGGAVVFYCYEWISL